MPEVPRYSSGPLCLIQECAYPVQCQQRASSLQRQDWPETELGRDELTSEAVPGMLAQRGERSPEAGASTGFATGGAAR